MNRAMRHMLGALGLSAVLILLGAGCGGQSKVGSGTTPPPPERVEKGFTLILIDKADPHALSCTLSKGQKKDEDHVRWYNQTSGPVTITFKVGWPFMESNTAMSFTVAAGKFSEYFTLNPDTPNTAYDYDTNPTLVDPGTGHGEPTISVGD